MIAVTVVSSSADEAGFWSVVDTHGRLLRLGVADIDARLVTLHPGQRLQVRRHPDGRLSDAAL